MTTSPQTRIRPGDHVSNAAGPATVTEVYQDGQLAALYQTGAVAVGHASCWSLASTRVESIAALMARGYDLDAAVLVSGPLDSDRRAASRSYGARIRAALDAAREVAIATGRPLGS